MTKVQLRYDLLEPLNDQHVERIARLHGVYGIFHVKLSPNMDALTVEYDASRLSPFEVETVLARAGLPVGRKA